MQLKFYLVHFDLFVYLLSPGQKYTIFLFWLRTLSHDFWSCQIVKLNNFGSSQVLGKLKRNLGATGRDVSNSICSALAFRVFPEFCWSLLLRCCESLLPTSTLEMAIFQMGEMILVNKFIIINKAYQTILSSLETHIHYYSSLFLI